MGKAPPSNTAMVLRIELCDTQPVIHRTVVVPARITLPRLHAAFQLAMGWLGGHLHEFIIDVRVNSEPFESPLCLYGAHACPPEDVGGGRGYEAIVQAMADPANPEHEDMTGWHGGSFDPTTFDLDAVNHRSVPRAIAISLSWSALLSASADPLLHYGPQPQDALLGPVLADQIAHALAVAAVLARGHMYGYEFGGR